MGGSQGAAILNQTLPETLAQLGAGYQVRHQAGKGNQDKVLDLYQQHHVANVEITDFIDDVAQAYAWADIVVCRSGALTVSEVSAAGVGCIFVPFMHKDRQQALNADHLVEQGAALMVEQPDLTAQGLAQLLSELKRDDLLKMAIKARQAAIIDADVRVSEAIKALSK